MLSEFSKKIKLSNGLTVIYENNPNSHIVSLNMGVKAGSAHEAENESGLCHLIEHMVFKGTKSTKPGEIATLVESHGGELNAYTSLDQTVYYINLPSQNLKLGLKLLKEMVFDATMDAAELEREKEVVVEEINRGQDNPHRVLSDMIFSNFFSKHVYRRPVIGTKESVRSFSAEKILDFYKKNYTPQNMILGICGDVDENEVSSCLEEFFHFETSHVLHDHDLPNEPPKKGHAIVRKSMDIQATYFELAFSAPGITHKDVPALDLTSHLLGESETSLLEQITKEKNKFVHSIYSSCFTPRHTGIFMIGGQVEPKLLNSALASIKEQIEFLKTAPIDEDKIERAKSLARSQLIYEKQTCEGTARKWMLYETMALDYLFDQEYIKALSRLTADDVQEVSKKYLNLATATLAVLHAKKIRIKINENIFNGIPRKKKKQAAKQTLGVNIHRLDNGIKVLIKENHRLPIIALKTASLGGLRYEKQSNNGINQLLSAVVTRSSKNLSQIQLAEKCEWLAGNLSSYTGRNSFGFSFTFLREKLHQALPLFADVITNPAFNKDEIASEKKLQLVAIKNTLDQPAHLAFRLIFQELFKNHPYALDSLGEIKSVTSLKQEGLRNYYYKFIAPNNFVIACVGDFDGEKMFDLLNRHLGSFSGEKFKAKKIEKPRKPSSLKKLFFQKNKMQAHIALGFLGTSLYDNDKYVLEVIHHVLSGQGGRLFLNLRDQQSLAYTVTSTMISGLETGLFAAYIGTEPTKSIKALREMQKEIERIRRIPISKEDLERAKNYMIGNHEIDHQKNGAIAMQFALNEIYGLGVEEFYNYQKNILKITEEDILRVAKKYFDPDKSVVAMVGPHEVEKEFLTCRGGF